MIQMPLITFFTSTTDHAHFSTYGAQVMAKPRMNMQALTIITVQLKVNINRGAPQMGSYILQFLDRWQGPLPFPLRRKQKAKPIARGCHRSEVNVAQTIDISAKLLYAGMILTLSNT
jgi:hypothetical protein